MLITVPSLILIQVFVLNVTMDSIYKIILVLLAQLLFLIVLHVLLVLNVPNVKINTN